MIQIRGDLKMGLADCCCGPIDCAENDSVVQNKLRRRAPQSKANIFTFRCLAYTLIGLFVIACHWNSLAESKKIHAQTHPDHSDQNDYDDEHDQDTPDSLADSRATSDDDHNDHPDHFETHLDQSGEHPDHLDNDHDDEDDDADAKSRADLPTSSASSKSDGVATKSRPSTSTAKPSRTSTTGKSDDQTKKIQKDHLNDAAKVAENASNMAKTKSPKKMQLNNAIKNLESEAKKVEAKKNNTIIINGRRFDQVNPIECVDEQFYAMLMKDLSLINPTETHDEYETYYDSERAMAIGAIVDAPATKRNSAFGRQLELAAGKGGEKLVDAAAGSGASRAASSVLDDNLDNDMTSEQLIHEIKEFWRQTNKTYSDTSIELNLKFKRRKRAARKQSYRSRAALETTTTSSRPKSTRAATSSASRSTAKPSGTTPAPRPPVVVTGKSVAVKPNYKKALENHYYLMRRLEELKSMLLSGEEALIMLNNRVKKLQQAVGENELKRALCSCITSRGGRAALMLMSELFTDKNALKMLTQLDQAKHKAELAARDTAEFCAYWYGDTLRSQAIIKEKQIKRLIVKIKGEYERHSQQRIIQNQTTTTTTVQFIKEGNSTKMVIHRETKIKVISKVVEMTRLWRPELSLWIERELGPDFVKEFGNLTGVSCNSRLARSKRRAPLDEGREMFMSTPFDQNSLYSDIDDDENFETSAILQSFVANNFRPALWRGRRDAGSTTSRKPQNTPTIKSQSTTKKPASSTTKKPANSTTKKLASSTTKKPASSTTKKLASSTTKKPASSTTKKPAGSTTVKPASSTTKKLASKVSSTTSKSVAQSTTTLAPNKSTSNRTANFEDRVSRSANKCAKDGFTVLLGIAYDENAILYESSRIKRESKYIETLRESFISSFDRFWVEKRNEWSRKFAADNKNLPLSSIGCFTDAQVAKTFTNSTHHLSISHNTSSSHETSQVNTPTANAITTTSKPTKGSSPMPTKASTKAPVFTPVIDTQVQSKSVDDLIDDALEPTGNAYERGASLGFTIGKFIGEKAARQWPDPIELNTFTYDSLFLAGVGHNFNPQQTRQLEDLIVTETAKRVAFSEASRLAFARALHTAYLNGAFVVPEFGVLHGQRAISKRAAIEGAQVGFAAASKSAAEFGPAAVKFFRLHEHQRSLAEPYKKSASNKTAPASSAANAEGNKKSLLDRIDEVRAESELNANITRITLECGQKTGAIMGALVGLLVTPEAFETYARVRGSLEAVEGEFYRYKLGALRGYELGESWAILNYTNAMAKRLDSFRADIGRADLSGGLSNSSASPALAPMKPPPITTKKPRKSKDNATHIPDDKMVSTVTDTDPRKTNVNNVFQFMVVNYGERLVANHTKGSMLTFRALGALDEATLREMKAQSGDMVQPAGSNATRQNEDEDIFETVKVAGELRGSLGSVREKSTKFPLKLEILDLGPIIEFGDEIVNKSQNSNRTISLEAIPLTEALSKVNKIYVKLRVARQNGSDVGTAQAADVLEAYLNNDQTDGGDGFMCGSYSLLGASPSGTNDTRPHEAQDDLALEMAILDELYQRIENLKPGQDAVAATESLLRVTTAAPSRVTSFGSSTTSAPSTPRLRVTSTSRQPPGANGTTPRATNSTRTTTTSTTKRATTMIATAASNSRASFEDEFDGTENEEEADSDSDADSLTSFSPEDDETSEQDADED